MYKGLIQKVGFFVKQILGSAEKEAESVRKDVVFRSVRRTYTFSTETVYFRIPRRHNETTGSRSSDNLFEHLNEPTRRLLNQNPEDVLDLRSGRKLSLPASSSVGHDKQEWVLNCSKSRP